MPITTDKGAMAVTVADTTGKGLYAADGSRRVTLVSGVSYVGLHAADSSLNVVLDSEGTGQYHPSGALRGSDKGITGYYTESGGVNMSGLNVPSQLFSASEPGVWYDPSDLTTLYQDSAGTTPVTAPAQPVGLMLSKDQGLALGSQLTINGSFDTDTGWTKETGWAIAGGTANKSAGTAGSIYQGAAAMVQGQTYEIVFTASNVTAGTLTPFCRGTAGTGITANGTYTQRIIAGSTAAYAINFFAGATFAGSIDNISVKLLAGNHATQSTSASRPTYAIVPATGRRNLLTYSEQFDNAVWSKAASSIAANNTTAPDGTATADKLVEDTANATHQSTQFPTLASDTTYTYSVYAKASGRNWTRLNASNKAGTGYSVYFDLNNGIVGSVTSGATASIQSVGDGWYRCTVTYPSSTGVSSPGVRIATATGDAGLTYLGNGVDGIYIWGSQLETGSTATDYQKVVTAFEVTEVGIQSLSYLSFDGVDDFMVTPTITPGIDKVQVFAGVRKLSDAGFQAIAETSSTGSSVGSFSLGASTLTGDASRRTWATVISGTSTGILGGAAIYAAPDTRVVSILNDISQPTSAQETVMRLNGTAQSLTFTPGDAGTGDFNAYPMFIGRRGGTSNPFNGQMYGLITRFGSNLDGDAIARTEKWLGIKTGVTV